MTAWWNLFNKSERYFGSSPLAQPEWAQPLLAIGTLVRITSKPEKIREVIEIEWHWHRHEFVYVIETSALNLSPPFKPYWFLSQLVSHQDKSLRAI